MIQGVVNKPGEVPFFKGMTRDLILIANGFQDRANTIKSNYTLISQEANQQTS